MKRSQRSYQREIQRLRGVLCSVEWYQPSYNGYASCPCCGMFRHEGHDKDCDLAIEIRSGEQRRIA